MLQVKVINRSPVKTKQKIQKNSIKLHGNLMWNCGWMYQSMWMENNIHESQ